MRTRIKICGITNRSDLDAAVSVGVDAVGFQMFPESPRYIEPELARELVSTLPPFVTSVGLFVNHALDEVTRIAGIAGFGLLQFHGDEDDAHCQAPGKPYMKVLRIKSGDEARALAATYPGANAILLDALVDGQYGGTGCTFDWQGISGIGKPVVLAGGLTPDNVAEAIRLVKPYAVDVASGVEAAPGKKDIERIKDFVTAVRMADEVSG